MEIIIIEGNIDREIPESVKNIEGWGIDADPENNPTYPIKRTTGVDHERLNYMRPPQQNSKLEILHSNERPGVTTVFGTSSPPSGLSGKLRRYAFKFSEGSAAHWMTLILADRVNAVEGVIDDLRNGHFPNIIKERGWIAEWKYNRAATIKKLATGVAVTAAVISIILYKNRSRKIKPSN
jgi:hypothetical protein